MLKYESARQALDDIIASKWIKLMLNVGNLAKESETNVYLAKYINMVKK